MSDPEPGYPRRPADVLALLAVLRNMAAAALTTADPCGDDRDLEELVVDGLADLGSGARVRRVRLQAKEQTVYGPASGSIGRAEALRAESMRRALAATDPIPSYGPDGEIVSLMAPLVSRTGAIDLFVLEAEPSAEGLSPVHGAMLVTLRDQAAAVLAVRHAQAEARLDPLTGCLNHGAMNAQLEREVARAQRGSGRLACVMLDLDNFKSINERCGHPVGDRILRGVARAMLAECRPYDSCCRYGGDEFLVILPDVGIAEALPMAERLRAAVARSSVDHDGEPRSVAATAGVAEWRSEETADQLIRRVDQALIVGKGAGKDGIGLA